MLAHLGGTARGLRALSSARGAECHAAVAGRTGRLHETDQGVACTFRLMLSDMQTKQDRAHEHAYSAHGLREVQLNCCT